MKAIMFANAVIEIAWIVATVYLIIYDHSGWAAATFTGAIISGYSTTTKTSPANNENNNSNQ